jgi:hypothetical protein
MQCASRQRPTVDHEPGLRQGGNLPLRPGIESRIGDVPPFARLDGRRDARVAGRPDARSPKDRGYVQFSPDGVIIHGPHPVLEESGFDLCAALT